MKATYMRVISVLNAKGGVGKTTISTHLARSFQIGGYTTTLVDADPQGSARDWGAARDDQPVRVIGIDRPTHQRDIKSLAPVDFVVIDGAPRLTELATSVVKASDLVLIPVTPSPYDCWAASDLVDLVRARIELTDGKLLAAFVISRAIANTKLGAEIGDVLAGYGIPVLNSRIYQRQIYASSAAGGQTAFDLDPNGEAANDFVSLRDEVIHLLK